MKKNLTLKKLIETARGNSEILIMMEELISGIEQDYKNSLTEYNVHCDDDESDFDSDENYILETDVFEDVCYAVLDELGIEFDELYDENSENYVEELAEHDILCEGELGGVITKEVTKNEMLENAYCAGYSFRIVPSDGDQEMLWDRREALVHIVATLEDPDEDETIVSLTKGEFTFDREEIECTYHESYYRPYGENVFIEDVWNFDEEKNAYVRK